MEFVGRTTWGLATGAICGYITSEGEKRLPSIFPPSLKTITVLVSCCFISIVLLGKGAKRTEKAERDEAIFDLDLNLEKGKINNFYSRFLTWISPLAGYMMYNEGAFKNIYGGLPVYYTIFIGAITFIAYSKFQIDARMEGEINQIKAEMQREIERIKEESRQEVEEIREKMKKLMLTQIEIKEINTKMQKAIILGDE